MTSNYSTIDMEEESKRKRKNNVTIITLRIYTTYVTLTIYYIAKDTFRWQVIKA